MKKSPRVVLEVPPFASRIARSPGYWRTTIGAEAVPVRVVLMAPVPAYMPPRNQIVSPGCTRPLPPFMAVCKSHGRLLLPSPPGEPVGAAYQPARLPDETVTVTVAVPVLPSLVAVIVAEAAATPVTRPLAETVATPGALLAQVTTRPVSTLPAESFVVAVSCTAAPPTTLAEAGLTVTEATGTFATVTVAVPLFPSLVAVIVAEPAAFAVTNPVALTVATVVLLLAQLMTRPVNTLPAESFVVAASCAVWPTKTLAEAGLTVTEATDTVATVTVITAVPFCPSLLAVIVAVPATAPVTSPLPLTAATVALLVAHVTVRPVSGLPFASFGVATSCTICPTVTVAEAGLTAIDATGTTVTVIAAVPLCPSHAAVTVAAPGATPLTSPLLFTAATPGLVDAHVTTRPLN